MKRLGQASSGPQESAANRPPASVREVLRSCGHSLDAETRAFFEPRFRHDLGKVRIHADSRAAESANAVGARAYTVGNHISFGTGAYQPRDREGRRLLAHELAHVVQQSQATRDSPGEAHLEADADHAASTVISGGFYPRLASARQAVLQRQAQGGGARTPTSAAPNAPNARQQSLIDDARRAAAIRCQTAMFRVRAIVPAGPANAVDASAEMAARARSLARLMFDWNDPNMEQIGDIVGSMVTFLTSGVQVMIAAAGDPECGQRAAYVRGLRPPIVLCPTFFASSPEQRVRTMIHESAHLARIGSAALGESYCVDFDCATPCGNFDSADSWAHFVHCLSGQTPDKPTTITGHASPGGGQGQTPASPPHQSSGAGR